MRPHARPLLTRLTYANVMSTLAFTLVIGGGTAYAANTVFSTDIVDGEVKTADLAANSVTGAKVTSNQIYSTDVRDDTLASGGLSSIDLAADSVGASEIAANSVDSEEIINNSLTLSDLLGANVSGAISFSLSANHCGDLSLGVSGAQVGQIVVYSFTGNTAVPGSVVFGGSKVTAANTIVVRACNISGSAVSVSNLGIHIATFG